MIKASKIGLTQNHALLANLPELQPNPNHDKTPLYFMKGDPTEFGLEFCRMSQEGFIFQKCQGYQIVKDQIMQNDNHSYVQTHGTQQARDAISKQFDHGRDISSEDVVLTSGVNFGLYYIFLSSCEEGQNILVPEIGYPFFDMIAPSYGVEVRKYGLKQHQNWEVNMEDLNQLIDVNTKFLFIINPSNPCGSVFSRKHVQEIVQWAQTNCLMIVSDEVYYGLSFGEFTSFGQEALDGPIICLCGLEKIFYVPGWCTAWMIFYDKHQIAKEIREAVGNGCQLFLHTNTFLMNSIPLLFQNLGIDYVKKSIPTLKENHDRMVESLKNIDGLECIPAQGTFYLAVLIDLKVLEFSDDVEFLRKLLEEENLTSFPLSLSGTKKYQGIRLLTCIKPEMIDELSQRLRQFCGRHIR